VHASLVAGQGGVEVTFNAKLIADPIRSGSHEHLPVADPQGDQLEVDHNIDLAPWVPARAGDVVVVHGQLYVDAPGRTGVHCTHSRTSGGCPVPGWIELRGSYYE
jgi:Protein of unknown function (DUF3465)